MLSPLVQRLSARDELSDHERSVLDAITTHVRTVPAREDIVRQHERVTASTLLLEGFAARYKILGTGTRQITSFQLPGDFVDLHGFLMHRLDHGVTALSECRVAVVPHEAIKRITEEQPHLARLLWLDTVIDGAIHREWLVAMGRLSATGHAAHLICELYLRLDEIGRVQNETFHVPVTQEDLGDALGVSGVQVNRSLQELRRAGLITWRGKTVTVLDWKRLAKVGEFDPTYLNLLREPR